MPVRYFLDANMASCAIKGNVPPVGQRLLRVPLAEVGISVIAGAELRFGVGRKPDIRDSKPWWRNSGCGSRFWRGARQPRDARHHSAALSNEAATTMGNLDTMIAAHALSAPAMPVTHDHVRVKHVKVEVWTKAA
jgi:predicted nucleic acid-binding protein